MHHLFLIKEEWKAAAEIKAVLYNTSRLTKNCRNEEKLNAVHRPVMRKTTLDALSSGSLEVIDVDTWSD